MLIMPLDIAFDSSLLVASLGPMPLENAFDSSSLIAFSAAPDLTASAHTLSPIGSLLCDFSTDLDEGETLERASGSEICYLSPAVAPGAVVQSRSLRPDLAMIAPCPLGSPLFDFYGPSFGEFSSRPNRRALMDHFCNVLSNLVVFSEESGNPFRQLVLPLTAGSSHVMNAIYALASAHLEYRGIQNGEKSTYFHSQVIQRLVRLIKQDGQVNRNELLAVIILIVYYEVVSPTWFYCTRRHDGRGTAG